MKQILHTSIIATTCVIIAIVSCANINASAHESRLHLGPTPYIKTAEELGEPKPVIPKKNKKPAGSAKIELKYYDFEKDGIFYLITNDKRQTVCVARHKDKNNLRLSEYFGDIIIPSKVTYNKKTYKVTEISSEAFQRAKGLKSISIPKSVKKLDWCSFWFCENLTAVKLSNGIKNLGGYTFDGCHRLKSINIPPSVTELQERVFAGCDSIESITIPRTLTDIHLWAFGDGHLHTATSITVEKGNPVYDSRENCNAIIESASNTMLVACKNTTIPASVINAEAFQDVINPPKTDTTQNTGEYDNSEYNSITEITIPDSLTKIDWFDNHTLYPNLTEVTIPSSVTEIGYRAFAHCDSLQSIYFQSPTPPQKICSTAFDRKSKKTITIYAPSGSKALYEDAFKEHNNVVIKEYADKTDTYCLTLLLCTLLPLYLCGIIINLIKCKKQL